MPQGLRHRFWPESVFGSITGIFVVVTLVWHHWIEVVFGVDPDKGNGSAEWLVVVALLVITTALAVSARFEWRRARLAKA